MEGICQGDIFHLLFSLDWRPFDFAEPEKNPQDVTWGLNICIPAFAGMTEAALGMMGGDFLIFDFRFTIYDCGV